MTTEKPFVSCESWVGVRCLGALWLYSATATVIHAIALWLMMCYFGGLPWVLSQVLISTAAVEVSCRAIVACGLCYYLMYKGRRLERVVTRKVGPCDERPLYLLRLFIVLLGVALCLRAFHIAVAAPVQLALLNMSSQWKSADAETVGDLNIRCLAALSRSVLYLLLGIVLYKKCDTVANYLHRRLPWIGGPVPASTTTALQTL